MILSVLQLFAKVIKNIARICFMEINLISTHTINPKIQNIMERKKSKKVDLKNKRVLFFEIGMLMALLMLLGAFQITTSEKIIVDLQTTITEIIPPELMPITRPEQPKPPEPPKPKIIEVIEIIDNMGIDDPEPIVFQELEEPIIIMPILEDEPEEEMPVDFAEVMPSFKGGMKALANYLQSELEYPRLAVEGNMQGKVFVRFVVNKLGKVENVSIARGVDPILDKEALRVVQNMPEWNPGMQNFKTISVNYTIPINFRLN